MRGGKLKEEQKKKRKQGKKRRKREKEWKKGKWQIIVRNEKKQWKGRDNREGKRNVREK